MNAHRNTTRLLESLSAEQREVLRLRIVHGLSAEQAELVLGISAAAVRVAQHRALEEVRALLSQQERTSWASPVLEDTPDGGRRATTGPT